MALSIVQSGGGGFSAATSVVQTFGATATVGDLLFIVLRIDAVQAGTTGPAGYTKITGASDDDDGGAGSVQAWYKVADGTETGFTITFTSSNNHVEWVEVGGASGWALDKTNANDPSAGATSCTTGTTGTLSSASSVAFAFAAQYGGSNGGTEAIDSGFTSLDHGSSRLVFGYLFTAATTALNPSLSWATSRPRNAGIATFTYSTGATGTAALAGSGTLTAAGSATSSGASALTGTGTLGASAAATSSGSAVMAGAGTLAAAGTGASTGTAGLTGTGTVGASGLATATGAATVTASGSFAAGGTGTTSAAAVLTGAGSLTATAVAVTTGSAALAGAGTLVASGSTGTGSAAPLAGAGTLTVSGFVTVAGAVGLAATGTLTATAGGNLRDIDVTVGPPMTRWSATVAGGRWTADLGRPSWSTSAPVH